MPLHLKDQIYATVNSDAAYNGTYKLTFPNKAGTLALTSDLPTVNNATLTIQKNGATVQTFTANQSTNATANITVPTNTNELTNGAGFITSSALSGYLPLTGGTLTGKLTGTQIETGTAATNYFQAQKFRGQGDASTYYHAIDFGYGGHDQVDFYEYGGIWNFWRNRSATATTDANNLALGITIDALKNKSYTYTFPNKTGTFALTSDIPTVPTNVSAFTNDAGYLTSIPTASASTLGGIKVGSGLSISNGVLSTQSTAPDWSDITNKPTFATVATSGSYNDLSNKPAIPAAQVNSDWNAASGVAQILNKPTLATVATSGSYNDLSNKPTIPTVNNATLTIQKNGTTVKTFTANASSNVTANITVPTQVSDLSDYQDYATMSDLATKQNTLTAGDHINITGSTIKAEGYVHSENPQAAAAASSTITGSMIASGTITADKLATGATVQLTLSSSDIGEGSPLAANTLYGVYL